MNWTKWRSSCYLHLIPVDSWWRRSWLGPYGCRRGPACTFKYKITCRASANWPGPGGPDQKQEAQASYISLLSISMSIICLKPSYPYILISVLTDPTEIIDIEIDNDGWASSFWSGPSGQSRVAEIGQLLKYETVEISTIKNNPLTKSRVPTENILDDITLDW